MKRELQSISPEMRIEFDGTYPILDVPKPVDRSDEWREQLRRVKARSEELDLGHVKKEQF